MRQLAIVLIVVAALCFLVGIYASLTGNVVIGKPGTTFWRGAIAMLLFTIAVLQLHTAPKA
jgi:multisubunit Na+/H+ antiporter MnhC subunit